MSNNRLKNKTGKKGKRQKSKKKKFKNGKKKKIKLKGNKNVDNSQRKTNTRSEDPLNKGPYGFEHPEAIDVKQNVNRFSTAA